MNSSKDGILKYLSVFCLYKLVYMKMVYFILFKFYIVFLVCILASTKLHHIAGTIFPARETSKF